MIICIAMLIRASYLRNLGAIILFIARLKAFQTLSPNVEFGDGWDFPKGTVAAARSYASRKMHIGELSDRYLSLFARAFTLSRRGQYNSTCFDCGANVCKIHPTINPTAEKNVLEHGKHAPSA
jgi:hypothetical protein